MNKNFEKEELQRSNEGKEFGLYKSKHPSSSVNSNNVKEEIYISYKNKYMKNEKPEIDKYYNCYVNNEKPQDNNFQKFQDSMNDKKKIQYKRK